MSTFFPTDSIMPVPLMLEVKGLFAAAVTGALALISAPIPEKGSLERSVVSRFVLDQDTGSAIKGAGRVDIFMGTGKSAGDRAGLINHDGKLYYLLLRN
jgi:membrane-bound lytic murein transglycosylase A